MFKLFQHLANTLVSRCICTSYVVSFAMSSFFETHFKIKTSGKILRRFDLTEIIFKYKKNNKTLLLICKITRENVKSNEICTKCDKR